MKEVELWCTVRDGEPIIAVLVNGEMYRIKSGEILHLIRPVQELVKPEPTTTKRPQKSGPKKRKKTPEQLATTSIVDIHMVRPERRGVIKFKTPGSLWAKLKLSGHKGWQRDDDSLWKDTTELTGDELDIIGVSSAYICCRHHDVVGHDVVCLVFEDSDNEEDNDEDREDD